MSFIMFFRALILFVQCLMRFSTKSMKSIRYWNPWKIHSKKSFYIFHFVIFNFCCKLHNFTNVLGDFSNVLLKLKLTSHNLSDTIQQNVSLSVFFSRYSLNLYNMKLNLLVWISLLHKC